MIIGMVSTVSEQWHNNVLEGISKGIVDIDYWTDYWLPDVEKEVDRLEVYYKGTLSLAGNIIDRYKDTHNNVFAKYKNNLYTIGLLPQNSINDFTNMLKSAFNKDNIPEIGNIIFQVDGISSTTFDHCKNNGISIPDAIHKLPDRTIQNPIRRIAYRQE